METVETISNAMWWVWALIGVVGGFMLGRSKARGAMYTVLTIVVAVAFAIAGGWCFCYLFGATEKLEYLSLIVAVATCAIGLWIFSFCTRRRTPTDIE